MTYALLCILSKITSEKEDFFQENVNECLKPKKKKKKAHSFVFEIYTTQKCKLSWCWPYKGISICIWIDSFPNLESSPCSITMQPTTCLRLLIRVQIVVVFLVTWTCVHWKQKWAPQLIPHRPENICQMVIAFNNY